jgi:hypothetical protein
VRPPAEERVDQVTERMQDSVKNMLIRIESELDAADSKIGQKLHLLVRFWPFNWCIMLNLAHHAMWIHQHNA